MAPRKKSPPNPKSAQEGHVVPQDGAAPDSDDRISVELIATKLTLCLETTGIRCAVALMDGPRLIAATESEDAHGTERYLPRLVQTVMQDTGFDALDAIAVCSGPGSFTGLRAGISFARGLALACDRPSYGVTSPAALFATSDRANSHDVLSLVALPARRRAPDKSWWIQSFLNAQPQHSPHEADTETLTQALTQAHRLISPDLGLESLAQAQNCSFHPQTLAAQSIGHAVRLDLFDSSPASPVYVRAPDAKPGQYAVSGPAGLDRQG